MHDRIDQQRMNDDALTAALRALPVAEPPHDGWPRLAASVARERHKRTMLRIALPAALAAGVAVMLWLPHVRPAPVSPAKATQQSAPASADADLAVLRAHSQRLQTWVRTLDRDAAPLDGDALATAVALQDRIGLVDLQLSAVRDPAASAALWQQRITLLEHLGMLRMQPYALAEHTRAVHDDTTIL